MEESKRHQETGGIVNQPPRQTTYQGKPEQTYTDKVKSIINQVENYYNLKSGTIFKYGRTKTTAQARKVAIYMARQQSTLSDQELADEFNRDHSNLRQAYKSIAKDRHLLEVAAHLIQHNTL